MKKWSLREFCHPESFVRKKRSADFSQVLALAILQYTTILLSVWVRDASASFIVYNQELWWTMWKCHELWAKFPFNRFLSTRAPRLGGSVKLKGCQGCFNSLLFHVLNNLMFTEPSCCRWTMLHSYTGTWHVMSLWDSWVIPCHSDAIMPQISTCCSVEPAKQITTWRLQLHQSLSHHYLTIINETKWCRQPSQQPVSAEERETWR